MEYILPLVSPGYLITTSKAKLYHIGLDRPRDPKAIDENDLFYLRLLNVGNLISRGVELKIPELEFKGRYSDFYFYKIPDPLPRFWLTTQVEIKTPEQVWEAVKTRSFDPKTTTLLEDKIEFLSSGFDSGKAQLLKFAPGKWEFELELPAIYPSQPEVAQYVLVVGENYFPGWRAFLDGEEKRVYRADYLFLGLALPSGKHHLSLKYYPIHSQLGLFCRVCAGIFWLFSLLVFLKRKFNKFR